MVVILQVFLLLLTTADRKRRYLFQMLMAKSHKRQFIMQNSMGLSANIDHTPIKEVNGLTFVS